MYYFFLKISSKFLKLNLRTSIEIEIRRGIISHTTLIYMSVRPPIFSFMCDYKTDHYPTSNFCSTSEQTAIPSEPIIKKSQPQLENH